MDITNKQLKNFVAKYRSCNGDCYASNLLEELFRSKLSRFVSEERLNTIRISVSLDIETLILTFKVDLEEDTKHLRVNLSTIALTEDNPYDYILSVLNNVVCVL